LKDDNEIAREEINGIFMDQRGAKLGQDVREKDWNSTLGNVTDCRYIFLNRAIYFTDNLKISSQEVVSNIPKVYWEDIGGLEEVRKEVLRTVLLPIRFPFLRKSGLKRSGIFGI